MELGLFHKMGESLRAGFSNFKAYLFARHSFDSTVARTRRRLNLEVMADLSDRRTFFAWQRNHMANERTFLSWCRTGISIIAFGFVVERFDILIREMRLFADHPELANHARGASLMGVTAMLLGAVIILLAGWRFFHIRKHINMGRTDFSILPDVFLMGSVLATVGTVVFFFAFFF